MIERRGGMWVNVTRPGCRSATQTEIEMHLELERIRQNAERYLYLRDERRRESLHLRGAAAGVWCDCEAGDGTLTLLTGDDLDAAVDAAMNAG